MPFSGYWSQIGLDALSDGTILGHFSAFETSFVGNATTVDSAGDRRSKPWEPQVIAVLNYSTRSRESTNLHERRKFQGRSWRRAWLSLLFQTRSPHGRSPPRCSPPGHRSWDQCRQPRRGGKRRGGDLELRLFGLPFKTRRYGQVQGEIEMLAVVMAEPRSPEGVKRVKSYLSE